LLFYYYYFFSLKLYISGFARGYWIISAVDVLREMVSEAKLLPTRRHVLLLRQRCAQEDLRSHRLEIMRLVCSIFFFFIFFFFSFFFSKKLLLLLLLLLLFFLLLIYNYTKLILCCKTKFVVTGETSRVCASQSGGPREQCLSANDAKTERGWSETLLAALPSRLCQNEQNLI
jgi:hypothetical protein